MKKLVLAILIAAVAIGGTAFAQTTVGIYFDDGAAQTYAAVEGITAVHAYCMMTDVSSVGVGGFELGLQTSGPLAMAGFTYPVGYGAINVQSVPTFMVGFAEPIPAVDGAVTLMEFDVIVSSANTANWTKYTYDPNNEYDDAYEARILVKEIFFHSLEDAVPAYLDEAGEILPMTPAISEYRGHDCSTIELITGPVATDEASWGQVKSLYR